MLQPRTRHMDDTFPLAAQVVQKAVGSLDGLMSGAANSMALVPQPLRRLYALADPARMCCDVGRPSRRRGREVRPAQRPRVPTPGR